MLSERYKYDGKPLLKLNTLQLETKAKIDKKVENGIYKLEEIPCAICKSENFELLAEKDRYGLFFSVVICKDCGLIQTTPRMNQAAYNKFYDTEYRHLYVGTEAPKDDFFQRQKQKGKRIYEYINSEYGKNFATKYVLEIGCGAGGVLQYFKDQGWRVKGVDLGSSYVEYGKSQYDLDLSVGTLESLELDELPDLVIYTDVLEHILDPTNELKQVRKLLDDNGLLYIGVPGVKNLMYSYKMDFLQLMQNAHAYHFTLISLTNLLNKNDFELVAGNEKVYSIFKKNNLLQKSNNIENDYISVVNYLKKIEFLRKACPVPVYRIHLLPRQLARQLLKIIGVYDFILRLYHRIRK